MTRVSQINVQAAPDTLVLVYFSAHYSLIRTGRFYWPQKMRIWRTLVLEVIQTKKLTNYALLQLS